MTFLDCRTTLIIGKSNMELPPPQIVIGPAVIEFGDVSLRTLNSKPLMIVNHLPINILIEVDIDCRELRQSLPLTQVWLSGGFIRNRMPDKNYNILLKILLN